MLHYVMGNAQNYQMVILQRANLKNSCLKKDGVLPVGTTQSLSNNMREAKSSVCKSELQKNNIMSAQNEGLYDGVGNMESLPIEDTNLNEGKLRLIN